MKQLLIIFAVILTVMSKAFAADCNINLGVKKDGAKSAKLSGVSFSMKQIEALKTVCNVELTKMSKAELVADYAAMLDRKEAKELADKTK